MIGKGMAGKYDGLTKAQLIQLLEKQDRERPLGLVWERNTIEADQAISADFVACDVIPELCEKSAPWRNLVIEGDNYDALRWLRMAYSGRVKCIYIDPPYNTGNKDWVYNDHYFEANDRYRHSTWLEFLYRRLTLARDLLTDDGVILVSINDENRARLELLMDQALTGMRVGSLTWRSRTGGNEGGERFLSTNHEHILVYANKNFQFGGTEKSFSMYKYFDNKNQDWYRLSDLTVAVSYNDKRAGKAYYPLQNPLNGVWYPCNPDRVWGYVSKAQSTSSKIKTKFMEEWIALDRIAFPDDDRVQIWHTKDELIAAIRAGDVPKSSNALLLREELPDLDFWVGKPVGFGTPAFKRYKKSLRRTNQPLSSWITPKSEKNNVSGDEVTVITGTTEEGAKSVKTVFGEKAFNYAKPPSLIRELLRQASSPDDLILDFFAGSATTAQAVMELNAEGDGERFFVMVSSKEATADEPSKNLCRDITARRIRLLNVSEDEKFSKLSAEFAYLQTRRVDFEDLDYDLKPREVWAILEAMHDLPLTLYEQEKAWQAHQIDALTLVYVDRVDQALLDYLAKLGKSRTNAFVYAWAPGQLKGSLEGVSIEI